MLLQGDGRGVDWAEESQRSETSSALAGKCQCAPAVSGSWPSGPSCCSASEVPQASKKPFRPVRKRASDPPLSHRADGLLRSEEHTSELHSPTDLVCRRLP